MNFAAGWRRNHHSPSNRFAKSPGRWLSLRNTTSGARLDSLAVVGVLSDFSEPNRNLSWETLNLLARRELPFHIIEKSRSLTTPLTGYKAILYTDQETPGRQL